MAIEFINLNEEEQDIPLNINHPHALPNIKPDTKIIDGLIEIEEVDGICATYGIVTITKPEEIEEGDSDIEQICIKEDCDTSKYYGCANGDGAFQKDNLFSELTDEYQRTQARINLGIADEYAMIWGNIKGNLSNQKDLYTFVTDSIAFDLDKIVEEINLKLAQWACEINIRLNSKADIFSPEFAGKPTTTLPLMTDNSSRIASTEWVNAKIAAASIDDNVKAISLDPEYMCYGDAPTNVTVTWEYHKDVSSQTINDIIVPAQVRTYTFSGVTTSMVITLKYKYEDISAARITTFDIKYPIYYGTSPDYSVNLKTIDNIFTVTAGTNQYIYAMIPNGSNSALAVSSIIGGFKLLGTQEIFGNIYYIFRSTNTNLGETTIEVMNLSKYEDKSLDITTIKELLAAKADKYVVYTKAEVDKMFDDFSMGEGGLKNYYTKEEVDKKIPDISNKADRSEIPIAVSELENDAGYINEIPSEYVTEKKLAAKGYLTQEVEPAFNASAAKDINKSDITKWNNKVDKVSGMGLSEQSYTTEEKAKLQGLSNYSDTEVRGLISNLSGVVSTKANISDIPDISNKADKDELPTKVSELENDKGYVTSIPGDLITESELEAKGYLTSFTETDPTVPNWAKQPTKPSYTLDELGAEAKGRAEEVLEEANTYTNQQFGTLVAEANPSYDTFKKVGDAILQQVLSIGNINTELTKKANKTELFSKKYSDLTGTPTIPSITGLATEVYVNQKIAGIIIPDVDLSGYALKTELPDITVKVDKVLGKELSSNDFTNPLLDKLNNLANYDDTKISGRISTIEEKLGGVQYISKDMYNSTTPDSYFSSFDDAFIFYKNLVRANIVSVEYSANDYTIVYNKIGSEVQDINNIRIIDVTIYAHYTLANDIKMTFHLEKGETNSYTYSKQVIPVVIDNLTTDDVSKPLSASQGKILMDKLSVLENIINNLPTTSAIILE